MRGRFFLFLSLIFFGALPAAFADSPQVRASARVFATKFTVGDDIRVLVETETPRDFQIEPPNEKTDLTPFELKKVEISPIVRGKNRVRRTFVLTVTVFEKGSLQFPALTLRYKTPEGRTGQMQTAPLSMEIASVGRRPSDKDDIRPIKGPESLLGSWVWSWAAACLAAALAVILAVLMGLRVWRQKDDESMKPPQVRARLEIERLKDRDLVSDGKIQEFVSGLTDVLRRYVERRFQVDAMEKTTSELSENMKQRGMDRDVIERSKKILVWADGIKFAKEHPSHADLAAAEKEILGFVDETTPKEETPMSPGRKGRS